MDFKDNTKPIYLQLADRLCDSIVSGEYGDDCRLPSVREFAATVEVNANTVMRTYDYLQQSGVIYNKRGIGYFVVDGASKIIRSNRLDTFMNEELPELFERMKLLEISPDDLSIMYTQYCNGHSKTNDNNK